MAEFLFELFCEEIPARMQAKACADLERLMGKALSDASLSFDAMKAYATPRRLTLHIEGLPIAQDDVKEERRGPRADAPEKALEGFLRSTGLKREDLEEREEKKGNFLYAVIERKGRTTSDVLADIIPGIIRDFPWPKSMRWGDASTSLGSLRWVRPLQSIICLLDGAVVDFEIDGIKVGNVTKGHRFMAPGAFQVKDFADYKAKLKDAYVLLDPIERQDQIRKEAKALSLVNKVALWEDESLIVENAGLTEWPVVLMGEFDTAFLEVPSEVLSLTMAKNQKYFTLLDPQTKGLANKFLCVANIEADDGGRAIIEGNQKVLSARLSDAKFFWDQDLKVTLEERLPKLEDIVFHEKLGTLADKVQRVAALARELAPYCKADPDKAEKAARLSKADLVSHMVGEFPEVQGTMGGYYARQEGLDNDIAQAIQDHYKPQGPDDECPTNPISIAVSLADKIDTLLNFFWANERPTGSKDPYALRRTALGVVRLILENGVRLKLLPLFDKTDEIRRAKRRRSSGSSTRSAGLTVQGTADLSVSRKLEGFEDSNLQWSGELYNFIVDRLKVQQREKGVPHDLIDAVFSLGGEDDLVRLLARVSALQDFLKTEDGENLLTGYRRAANIVRIEEKKDKTAYDGAVDAGLLQEPQEKALYEALGAARGKLESALELEDFASAMGALSGLRAPVDTFFDDVTVNAEDAALRTNRLHLLSEIRSVMHLVADFSKIEG